MLQCISLAGIINFNHNFTNLLFRKFMIRYYFLVLFSLAACQSKKSPNLIEQDLLSYGIPITLLVPDSSDIQTMDWGLQKDITIQGGNGYSLQIFSSQATTHLVSKLKTDLLETVQENPYFSSIIREDEDGFIYELLIDSLQNFDFRHIKIQGDREYTFQAGMFGTYKLEQIEQLYNIARQAR